MANSLRDRTLTTGVLPALLACVALLAGCTSVKFQGTELRLKITPAQVVADGGRPQGTVVWGGRIVAIENLEDGTELHILSVPMTNGNVPKTRADSTGRFVVFYPQFLEPLEYAPGRWVSMAGTLDGLVEGQIGEQGILLPMVQGTQIHLWPLDQSRWQSNWNFGVGVGISL